MSKKIFISRSIDQKYWQSQLGDAVEIVGQSLIDITPIPFDLPIADWMFFYSKNGVTHFFEQSHGQLAPYKWAAIGKQTAALLSEYVMDVDFIGTGTGVSTAPAFQAVLEPDEIVCFVQAQNSLQAVQKAMKHRDTISISVYHNTPSSYIPKQNFDILIFTSPMNAKTYFQKRTYINETVIAIGTTTQKALHELGITAVMPVFPSEQGIVNLLLAGC